MIDDSSFSADVLALAFEDYALIAMVAGQMTVKTLESEEWVVEAVDATIPRKYRVYYDGKQGFKVRAPRPAAPRAQRLGAKSKARARRKAGGPKPPEAPPPLARAVAAPRAQLRVARPTGQFCSGVVNQSAPPARRRRPPPFSVWAQDPQSTQTGTAHHCTVADSIATPRPAHKPDRRNKPSAAPAGTQPSVMHGAPRSPHIVSRVIGLPHARTEQVAMFLRATADLILGGPSPPPNAASIDISEI